MCQPCLANLCTVCATPTCCCGHRGSNVRALTSQERHDYALGRHTSTVMPRASNGARP